MAFGDEARNVNVVLENDQEAYNAIRELCAASVTVEGYSEYEIGHEIGSVIQDFMYDYVELLETELNAPEWFTLLVRQFFSIGTSEWHEVGMSWVEIVCEDQGFRFNGNGVLIATDEDGGDA